MTKMATVQAQQMWEYMCVTRKTEDFLVAELNEAGKLGWELVNAEFRKDTKSVGGTYCWTAMLKRPLVPQTHHKTEEEAAETTPPELPSQAETSPSDSGASVFGLHEQDDQEEES